MPNDKNDLTPGNFPDKISWKTEDAIASMENISNFVIQESEKAIHWYFKKKQRKRILGTFFRIGAILLVTASGILPILSEMYKSQSGTLISPAWATITLALAALCITLDRFGGYTSGWIRYIRTGQKLSSLLSEFRLEWEQEKLRIQNEKTDRVIQSIEKCQNFLFRINEVVRAETDAWAKDFQKILQEVDDKIEEKPRSRSK